MTSPRVRASVSTVANCERMVSTSSLSSRKMLRVAQGRAIDAATSQATLCALVRLSRKNSPFAQAFVKNVQTPGLEVRRLFDYVRDDVLDSTKRQQQPFSYGSISGRQDFYFVAGK